MCTSIYTYVYTYTLLSPMSIYIYIYIHIYTYIYICIYRYKYMCNSIMSVSLSIYLDPYCNVGVSQVRLAYTLMCIYISMYEHICMQAMKF